MNQRPAPIQARPDRRSHPLLRRADSRRRLTPFRIGIAVSLVGSMLFILVGFINRAANQIPILSAGLAVLALTLIAIAVACVVTIVRAGRDGRDAHAFWAALAGGVAMLGAAGALAAAYVLALVWSSART
jgi:zinc transporter ZupT